MYGKRYILAPLHIAPLITFRILFGALMLLGGLRFAYNGWINRLYVAPTFFFKYYGFEWVQPLGVVGTYALFVVMLLGAAGIMLGLYYRAAVIAFLGSFSYFELLDVSNYLNHHYLIALFAFLLFWVPANSRLSLDVWRNPNLRRTHVQAWAVYIFQLQIGIVYTFAGLAKLNPDWLFQAMPLCVWLPANADLPIVGPLLVIPWVAYTFSWAGAMYDLSITAFLLHRITRPWAYATVIIFHSLTFLLFNIGLFPFIMVISNLLFFSSSFHEWLLAPFSSLSSTCPKPATTPLYPMIASLFGLYFIIQIALPFRGLVYPGHLLWTEQGFRLSWRVMLIEKRGHITFHVQDPATGRRTEIHNGRYLLPYQEKAMATQPDLILQFAHYLKWEYQEIYQIAQPVITADSFVAFNGRPTRRYIDPTVNLANISPSLQHKWWVLPFR